MVVIESIAMILFDVKDFDEVVKEAYFAERRLAEGAVGFEEDVFAFVALS